jgi:phosphatidylglycerophosphatase A
MTLLGVVIAFGLFRLFDIWKPWPIRTLDEQVHGGLGIMLDDLLAGLVGAVCLIVLIKCSLLNSLL